MPINIKNIPLQQNSKWKQGEFDKFNPKKYYGKFPIKFRSSWEFKCMLKFELNRNVLKWTSEPFSIPYYMKELVDGKFVMVKHNYWIDFIVELVNGTKFMIEVKPDSQIPKKDLKTIKRDPVRYKNACKFSAAIKYCKLNGYEFKLISEKDLLTKIF
jgi:hypothetical protein